jgi:hypothetical protein
MVQRKSSSTTVDCPIAIRNFRIDSEGKKFLDPRN